MTTRCSIELYDKPVSTSLEDLDGSPLDIFYALGIVNPFGPTLTFVAAAGNPSPGTALPLVKVMLNPFSQTVEQVGRFKVGDTWNPMRDLEPLVELDYGSCPTLLFITNRVDAETRGQLAAKLLSSFGDEAVQVWDSVERHYGDPWSRVSESMSGGSGEREGLDPQDAAEHLAEALFDPLHVRPELQAFFYAWKGSIQETGISKQLKALAMELEEFQEFFFDRVVPGVWLPDLSESDESESDARTEPKAKPPERLQLESLDDLERIVSSGEWKDCGEERLLDLLRALFFVYGASSDTARVQAIGTIYRHAVASGMDADTRMLLENEMGQLIDADKVGPVVFIPFLVLEDEMSIVTKATIDFLSSSGYVKDELYAITEIRNLFKHAAIADRGGVFGALVTIGDQEVLELAQELKPLLTTEEVRRAARVHTAFPQHHAIQFWLGWCKELVQSPAHEDQAKFGACASALILVLEQAQVNKVSAGKRNFPCQNSVPPITIEREWTTEQYAELLASDLYRLESMETAPRIFSNVLHNWGLLPQALITEQFIPPANSRKQPDKPLRDLSPRSKTKPPRGFLSRLFGSD
jgi:hypothetical protein